MADIPDSHRDLLDSPVATLATIDPAGRPQLTEVWFLADGDGTLRMSLNTARKKVRDRVVVSVRPARITAVDMRR